MPNTVVLSRKAAVALGALMGHLNPKLASDAKVDFYSILNGVDDKNFKAKIPSIIELLSNELKGKLAVDANPEDISNVLIALDGEAACLEPNSAMGKKKKAEDDGAEDDNEKDLDDEKEADPGPESVNKGEKTSKAKNKKKAKDMKATEEMSKDEMITKDEMNAAIKAAVDAVTKTQSDIREALKVVSPYVGELATDHACAEDVYKDALTILNIPVEGVHPSAFRTILELGAAQRKSNQGSFQKQSPIATDAAGIKSFNEFYPGASNIGVI